MEGNPWQAKLDWFRHHLARSDALLVLTGERTNGVD